MSDDPATRFRENVTEITATIVTGIWLVAMFTGQSWWLAALLFGYIVVVPLVALLLGDEDDRREWWDDWWGEESWSEWWGSDADPESDATTKSDSPSTAPSDNRDALERLRDRYARGELTDAQFERKLELLLETETLENADEWIREGREARERREREPKSEREPVRDPEPEAEREREREFE